jgi:hypothetical protein
MDFRHETSELSKVCIELAGMGTRRIRIANPMPEVPNQTICDILSPYGDVKKIIEDAWSKVYRYPVSNGICIAVTNLKKHIPSQLSIAGNRVLISYEGQLSTCHGCNETDHQYNDCPCRKKADVTQQSTHKTSWEDVVQQWSAHSQPEIARTQTNGTNTMIDPRLKYVTYPTEISNPWQWQCPHI